jgi:HD-GYP domain-containing protein (c-di-GMP phosphodiesterase class II)
MSRHQSFSEFLDHHPGQSARAITDKALRLARELMSADTGVLYLLRRGPGAARLEYAASTPAPAQGIGAVPLNSDCVVAEVARTGQTMKLSGFPADTNPPALGSIADACHGTVPGALVAFALKNYDAETIGVIALVNDANSGRRFADEHLAVLDRFNAIAGATVERADLLERIGESAVGIRERNSRLRRQAEELAELGGANVSDDAFRLAISLLARAAEIYDEGTGNHVFRVNDYSHFMARTLGMDEAYCRELRYSAQLHDVGKMGVAPALLRKTGELDPAERREMDNHTVYGHEILSRSPRLAMAAEIALNHHEKWNGTGYPAGRREDDIPLSARIVQVADIYDALRSRRPYKQALTHDQARDILLHGDDRVDTAHFDPRLIELFGDTHESFDRIWRSLAED